MLAEVQGLGGDVMNVHHLMALPARAERLRDLIGCRGVHGPLLLDFAQSRRKSGQLPTSFRIPPATLQLEALLDRERLRTGKRLGERVAVLIGEGLDEIRHVLV